MTKIYTRTGDKGTTSLYTGERVKKDDDFIVALGAVDKCNSALGVAISLMPTHDYLSQTRSQLETIQNFLLDIGAAIATPLTRANEKKREKTRFNAQACAQLEMWIDDMEGHLMPLTTFILPGGHPSAAMLHMVRSFCREAESVVVPLFDRKELSDDVVRYLNRLSDYLFVVSRYVNQQLGSSEATWNHAS